MFFLLMAMHVSWDGSALPVSPSPCTSSIPDTFFSGEWQDCKNAGQTTQAHLKPLPISRLLKSHQPKQVSGLA